MKKIRAYIECFRCSECEWDIPIEQDILGNMNFVKVDGRKLCLDCAAKLEAAGELP